MLLRDAMIKVRNSTIFQSCLGKWNSLEDNCSKRFTFWFITFNRQKLQGCWRSIARFNKCHRSKTKLYMGNTATSRWGLGSISQIRPIQFEWYMGWRDGQCRQWGFPCVPITMGLEPAKKENFGFCYGLHWAYATYFDSASTRCWYGVVYPLLQGWCLVRFLDSHWIRHCLCLDTIFLFG